MRPRRLTQIAIKLWKQDVDGRALALTLAPLMVVGLLITGLHQEPAPPLNVGPLVPATAEEERQWQLDQLTDFMNAERAAETP